MEEEIKEFIIYNIHTYIREMLGDAVFVLVTIFLLSLGLILLLGAITNSNILLGDPNKRDYSQLGEIEYLKTRKILRVILGIIGFVIFVYNITALISIS